MNKEIAILFRLKTTEAGNVYLPEKVITGVYNDETKEFIDEKGTPYLHIIDGAETFGFGGRTEISNYNKQFPIVPVPVLKALILHAAKRYQYIPAMEATFDVPLVFFCNKEGTKKDIYLDNDSFDFYMDNYPEFAELLVNKGITFNFDNIKQEEVEPEKKINNIDKRTPFEAKIDVNMLYNEITSNVIDQDEAVKKILTAIWKQYNNFSDTKSRNILINGSTGVGKTEIFRNLTKLIDVPCVMTSATQYTAAGYVGKNVEDMLVSLLDKADGDIEKAQKGILIIDELDKLAESNSSSQVNQRDVQEALLKLIEDSNFDIDYHHQNITFDTSKLMVVGMGSWSRIKLEEIKHIGFGATTEKKEYKDLTSDDIIANGMIPELIGRFPVIVQMNELNRDSFIRILHKSNNNALNTNKRFFEGQGIKLSLDDETINVIADAAVKNKLGARSLDTIVEKSLAVASFEIASHPDLYEELIITPETIKDNTKYRLVKRLENKGNIQS